MSLAENRLRLAKGDSQFRDRDVKLVPDKINSFKKDNPLKALE